MRLAESCMVDEFVFPFCIIVEAVLVDVKFLREFSKKLRRLYDGSLIMPKKKTVASCEPKI
jgi:hypothetical protein